MRRSAILYQALIIGVILSADAGCSSRKPYISGISLCAHPEGPVCKTVVKPDRRSSVFHITATLHNMGKGEILSVVWEYAEDGRSETVDRAEIGLPAGTSVISSSITMPEKGWPEGSYKVTLKTMPSGISESVSFNL